MLNILQKWNKLNTSCAGIKLVQGVASTAAGVKSEYSSIIWIGALKAYTIMLMVTCWCQQRMINII